MKSKEYLKDKWLSILLFLLMYCITLLMLFAFQTPLSLILGITFVFFLFGIFILMINYFRKKYFYQELLHHIEQLDKAYLVLETIQKPNFYEGKLLCQALYDINKSMNEEIKVLEEQVIDFKEYIEMWIHEVKMPLASLILMTHNQKKYQDKKLIEQIKRIEDYLEQVLYYVRAENAEKDYLIKEIELRKVIHQIALKNKDDLLQNQIDFIVDVQEEKVLTDSKWLEFILNQIINNSIKYHDEEKKSYLKISVITNKDNTTLVVEDNGIGISKKDLSRVFDKSFTGNNGRKKAKSTGMGLFIAKNLCIKLGHKLKIESEENKYTKVFISFSNPSFYQVIK